MSFTPSPRGGRGPRRRPAPSPRTPAVVDVPRVRLQPLRALLLVSPPPLLFPAAARSPSPPVERGPPRPAGGPRRRRRSRIGGTPRRPSISDGPRSRRTVDTCAALSGPPRFLGRGGGFAPRSGGRNGRRCLPFACDGPWRISGGLKERADVAADALGRLDNPLHLFVSKAST